MWIGRILLLGVGSAYIGGGYLNHNGIATTLLDG